MIAEVALNLPLRRTFDYLIPSEHRERIASGCRVIVPFGNRLSSGIVVGLKDHSSLAPERLKPLRQPGEGGVLFSEELLRFTRWMGEYYFCGWGEVLERALPSGLGANIRVRFRMKQSNGGQNAARALSENMRDFLARHEEWDEAQWKKAGASEKELHWLWRQKSSGGALEVVYEYAGNRKRPAMEKWVRAATLQAPPERGRRNPRKETRKDKVLRLLREEGEVAMGRLKAVVSAPSAVLKQLREEGLVEIVEREAVRRFRGTAPAEPFLQLNSDQETALTSISEGLRGGAYRAFLLEGVTGSGKTEVYLYAVREALALGRSCLLLVPEIVLTESIVNRFRSRFGDQVAVLHSGMSEGERFDEWRRVHEGHASIVIGARSAVFAPLSNLGLVVVDEEHDGSYKQDEAPRYHGRDAAMMRAHQNGAVVVLGSATPSLEAVHNIAQGKLERLRLPLRIKNRPMPEVEILDLKSQPRQKGSPLFTRYLVDNLREVLLRKEQAMLFLNRRGFANLVRCKACDETLLCEHCSITLTYHQAEERLRCHRCDFNRTMPVVCPACQAPAMEVIGLGTERIEREIEMMFPEARVLRMDSDTLRKRGELERMMEGIRRREYDVIIGTQVLSKGHDFPYITLVGAVLADVSLNLPDFRAAERTFQLLTQMAGRAGRGELPGKVLIQTYSPEHYSLDSVRNHDIAAFTNREMSSRQDTASPPFSSQTLIWVSGPNAVRAEALAHTVAGNLRQAAQKDVEVLGAVEGPIKKINNRFRWMILLKARSIRPLHRVLGRVFENPAYRLGRDERVAVDIDPFNLM
ncbi:MAG: primosomal protein N' [SAR324 cluster bacterium]|nr:primosomal protein N' [SAR324 cluster bacterium]